MEDIPKKVSRTVSRWGIDELNLAEISVVQLAKKKPRAKTIEWKEEIRKGIDVVRKEITITAADAFGLPFGDDDKVLIELQRLTATSQYNFEKRKLSFRQTDLFKSLGWPLNGKSYARLNDSLDRLSGLRLKTRYSWYVKGEKGAEPEHTKNVGLIDKYETTHGRGKKENSWIIWSDEMARSFRDNFVRRLDLDFWYSLKESTARKLCRYLGKRFYKMSEFVIDLRTLCVVNMGMVDSGDYYEMKRQLGKGIKELEDREYLIPLSIGERFYQDSNRTWKVRFIEGAESKRQKDHIKEGRKKANGKRKLLFADDGNSYEMENQDGVFEMNRPSEPASASVSVDLFDELVQLGCNKTTAKRFFKGFKRDQISDLIEYFKCESEALRVKRPGGWWGSAYKGDIEVPRDFVPSRIKSAKVDELKQQKRKEEQIKEQIEKEENEYYSALFNSMATEEKDLFTRQAMENADPAGISKLKTLTKNSSSWKSLIKELIRREIDRVHGPYKKVA